MLQTNGFFRRMTEQDVPAVMAIEKEVFSLPWSPDAYYGELKNQFANYLVCDYEGEIAAYGGIWVVFEDAHITNVAVGLDFRGIGMGKQLMLELEKIARMKKAQRILLEVRPSNDVALRLYASLDYLPMGTREKYYSDNGEDAIIMKKLIF